jgi:magnesium-transporting ATPase (P-type)
MSQREQEKQKQSNILEGRNFEKELSIRLMWYWVLVFAVMVVIIFFVFWYGFQMGFQAGQIEQLKKTTFFDNTPKLINLTINLSNVSGVG